MTTSIDIAHIIHITRDHMPKVRPALHRFNIIANNSRLCITNKVEIFRFMTGYTNNTLGLCGGARWLLLTTAAAACARHSADVGMGESSLQ